MRMGRWLVAVPVGATIVGAVGASMAAVPPATASQVTPDVAPFSTTGPHAVGVRPLAAVGGLPPMTHWYPARATAAASTTYDQQVHVGGPFGTVTVGRTTGTAVPHAPRVPMAPPPLVVLAPGYGVGAASYAWLAEHLASHGLAVVAHEAVETLASATGDGLWHATIDRPTTLASVVDELARQAARGGAEEGWWDPGHVAVVGHSFGGYAALAVGGARVDTDAFTARCEHGDEAAGFVCAALGPNIAAIAERGGLDEVPHGPWPPRVRDDLVDAVVALAGDAYLFDASGLASLTVPVLAIGGHDDEDTPWALGPAMTFEHAGAPRRLLVGLEGADHLVFTGRCDQRRRVVPLIPMDLCEDHDGRRTERHDVIAHVVTAFLLDELTHDVDAHGALAARPELPGTTFATTGDDDA